jgi:hypothetical protein
VPIALLPELTATLDQTGRALAPWSRLSELEEQILRRARGAFLVHWFGTSVPVNRLNLYIAITNIAELQERYVEVQRSMQDDDPELNLLGPLSGIAGFLVGTAVSPAGAGLIARYIREILSLLIGETGGGILGLFYRLIGFWILPILGPALGLIALPLLLVGALTLGLGGHPQSRMLYTILGELAMLLDATVRLWDVLTGPRTEVRNPLLRRILDVLDRFAGLFVQIVGFAALLVTRIVPLIPHIIAQFQALADLVHAAMKALIEIYEGIFDQLIEPFVQKPSLMTIVEGVLDSFEDLPAQMMKKITRVMTMLVDELLTAYGRIAGTISKYLDRLSDDIVAAFKTTPVGILVGRVRDLLTLMPNVIEAFRSARESQPEEEERGETDYGTLAWIFTGGLTGELEDLINSLGDLPIPEFPEIEIPSFPETPGLPDVETIMHEIGEPETIDISVLTERIRQKAETTMASRAVPEEILRTPISAFAVEYRELVERIGRPELDLDDERLRDLIYIAVGRVLPASLRGYAPVVREYFDMLDEEVYGIEREPLEYPVLDIEDSGRLRPVVDLLTIRARGSSESQMVNFRTDLLSELENRTYLATLTV